MSKMEFLLNLIEQHGEAVYALLFVYCVVKSGSLPIFAAMAASFGALHIGAVFFCVLAGGYLGDELRFWLVRRYGIQALERRPKWHARQNKAAQLLEKHGTAYLFFYRYPKGLRTIGAIPVALTSLTWQRFSLLNFASALVWASTLCVLGYSLAHLFASQLEQYWALFSFSLLITFMLCSLIAWRQLSAGLEKDHHSPSP